MIITGMNVNKPNIFLERVPRKTKSMVRILQHKTTQGIEDVFENFCEILFSYGGFIKGCQFQILDTHRLDDNDSERYETFNIVVYYEIEKEKVDQLKKDLSNMEEDTL